MTALARVTLNGKVGFIDRTGNFAIEPVFDKAWRFEPGFGRTSAERDGVVGVIDRTGAWVFQTNYQQIHLAADLRPRSRSPTPFTVGTLGKTTNGAFWISMAVSFSMPISISASQRCTDGRLVGFKNKEWFYFKADASPLQPTDGRIIDVSCNGSHHTR